MGYNLKLIESIDRNVDINFKISNLRVSCMDVKIKDDKTLGQIYKDALQPTAKQIGEALEEVSKTARLLLAPLSLCGVGFDRFQK